MNERFCPTGNHFRKLVYFNQTIAGRPHRDCKDCELAKSFGRKTALGGRIIEQKMDGVDIDAIHYKLGLVRRKSA